MKKRKIVSQPIRRSDLSFDDFYDEISSDLDLKIEQFQERRWRELRKRMI